MKISETTKHSSEQNPNAKSEENLWEPWKRIDECSDDLTSKSRGGSRKSRRGGRRRSEKGVRVSDLEAEETKGFMDLGFVFTKEDLNSELPDILPGLRTFLCREEQSKAEESSVVPRPYLSESWDFYNEKWGRRVEKDEVVIDLRMAALCGEMNMKESLKWWARSVASNLI